jgi:hypothetical protein
MVPPTHADCELILKLYETRREPEIRKARQWWAATFWPESADEVLKIMRSMGMFVIYAKLEPYLQELREKLQNPRLLGNLEKLIQSPKGQERYKITSRSVENMRKARQENLAKAS